MTSNRYLEALKRLLRAEAYFGSRKDAKEHEPPRDDKAK